MELLVCRSLVAPNYSFIIWLQLDPPLLITTSSVRLLSPLLTTKDSLGNGATTTHAAVRHDFHARPAWRGAGKDKKGKEGDGRGGEVA
jgi:hypothetical protein